MTKDRCESCHSGMPTYSQAEIEQKLAELKAWHYDETRHCIERRFEFKGFYKTMAFVNAVAWIAQTQGHHPDMQIGYNYAVVAYQTHEAGGITENDFICARQVDALLG